MALPPKGHPERPLRLASRSMLVLGIIMIVFSLCVGGAGIAVSASGTATPGAAMLGIIIVGLLYLAVGVGYILCWVYLKRFQRWAAIVGIVLASLSLLGSGLSAITSIVGLLSGNGSALFHLIFALLFVAAFAQLIYHLTQSFKVITMAEQGLLPHTGSVGHGFEPLNVHPVEQSDDATVP